MGVSSQAELNNITWRLHERQGRLHENMELRHKMLKSSYHIQLQNDKKAGLSHIHHLQPGFRKVFLQMRLEKIHARFK